MNTRQFFQRLLQPLAPSSLDNLSANEAMDMVGALNMALSDFYRFAPDRYRMFERSYPVTGPRHFYADFTQGERGIGNLAAEMDPPDAMVVEGGGSTEFNIYYFFTGSIFGGRKQYVAPGFEVNAPRITWETSDGYWAIIAGMGNPAYAGSDDSQTPDLVDEWLTSDDSEPGFEMTGAPPAPTVRPATWGDFPELLSLLSTLGAGCSLLVDGQSDYNSINDASDGLLHPFAGATGRYRFTVWGDAIALGGFHVERMYLHPTLQGGTVLGHDGALPQWGQDSVQFGRQGLHSTRTKQQGRPLRYGIRHTGSDGETVPPAALMILDPMPTEAANLRVGLVHQPVTFGMWAWSEPQTIPLPDSICWDMLLPLAWGELTLSSLWRDPENARQYKERASDARFAARSLPAYVGVPTHTIGTPAGW
jgi:hypothetical protein